MKGKVTCTCGWSWNKSDSSKKDMYICHECGRDNSNNMKNGGWMDNYNDSKASAPEGFKGDGYSNVGRDYSPAWGGQFQMGGKLNSSIPVIEDAGGYNEEGIWVPDWEAMTAQAKKLGAKKVKTKHGSLIVFDDNWEVIGVDDNPDAMEMGGKVSTTQEGTTKKPLNIKSKAMTSKDSVAYQADKILKYEQLKGGPGGAPLPYYSDPQYMNMLMNSVYPEVQKIMPNASAMEASEAMDFVFNAGWDKDNNKITKDPRAFALQEYYRKYDKSKLDKDGKWAGRKNPAYSFDDEYANTIGKLSENERRVLMNKGRDWYYQNINNPAPGVPSSNYNDTWYGRIWNTNDFLPFDPNNPKFTLKKQTGGSVYPVNYVPQAQFGESMFKKPSIVEQEQSIDPIYWYPERNLYPSEDEFLKERTDVGGMATEDNHVIINPYSPLSDEQKRHVAKLEQARLAMRNGYERPTFGITPKQEKYFNTMNKGEPYSPDKQDILETIASRIIVGDPTAQDITPEQEEYAYKLLDVLERSKDYADGMKSMMKSKIGMAKAFEQDPKFDSPEEAEYFAKHYKEVAPMTTFKDLNGFKTGGSIPQAQKGKRVNVSNYNTKLRKKEKDLIKKYVTPAQQRAQEIAVEQGINTGLHNGPLDAIRHSSSSAAMSSILPSWANFIPGVAPLNVLATNVAGALHEYNSPNQWKETSSDLYNNFIGSVVGTLPMSEKNKHNLLIEAQKRNVLSNLGDKTPVNVTATAVKREMGGSIPGATGSMYARVGAPSNGPYAKKTMASAKKGKIIKDDLGQWAHPGEITEIGSPYITMQGVPYPVLGISNTGDIQMMYPGEDYLYDGESVIEFPMAKNGLRQEQKGLQNLDNLLNFTNYNKPQPGGWLSKYE